MENGELRGRRERSLLPNETMSLVSAVLLAAGFGLLGVGRQLFDALRGPGVMAGVRLPYDMLGPPWPSWCRPA